MFHLILHYCCNNSHVGLEGNPFGIPDVTLIPELCISPLKSRCLYGSFMQQNKDKEGYRGRNLRVYRGMYGYIYIYICIYICIYTYRYIGTDGESNGQRHGSWDCIVVCSCWRYGCFCWKGSWYALPLLLPPLWSQTVTHTTRSSKCTQDDALSY